MDRRELIRLGLVAGVGGAILPLTLRPEPSPESTDRFLGLRHPPSGDYQRDLAIIPLQGVLLDVFPDEHLDPEDDYFGLLFELLALDYVSTNQVRKVCVAGREQALSFDREIVERICQDGLESPKWVSEYAERRARERGIFSTQVGLARTALIERHGRYYRPYRAEVLRLDDAAGEV